MNLTNTILISELNVILGITLKLQQKSIKNYEIKKYIINSIHKSIINY